MGKKSIKIVIAFSNMLFSEGIKVLLEDEKDFDVQSILPVCGKLTDSMQSLGPDVVLVDLTALYNNFDRSVNEQFILFDTCCGEDNIISSILSKGVKGIIREDTGCELLKKAIRAVAGGELWMDNDTVKNLILGINAFKEGNSSSLTDREREVVSLIKKGYTNREVARQLFISEPTVKSHLSNIFKKLKLQNRPQLIAYAFQKRDFIELT